MLDQNRAAALVAKKLHTSVNEIEDLCVWGNHSDTMFVDYMHAKVYGRPLIEVLRDEDWLKTRLQDLVAQRGGLISKMRGQSSALSATSAAIDTLAWLLDKSQNMGPISLGVVSNGEYGSQPGNIVSFPCVISDEVECKSCRS